MERDFDINPQNSKETRYISGRSLSVCASVYQLTTDFLMTVGHQCHHLLDDACHHDNVVQRDLQELWRDGWKAWRDSRRDKGARWVAKVQHYLRSPHCPDFLRILVLYFSTFTPFPSLFSTSFSLTCNRYLQTCMKETVPALMKRIAIATQRVGHSIIMARHKDDNYFCI